jgi:hypothetical protein
MTKIIKGLLVLAGALALASCGDSSFCTYIWYVVLGN